MFSTLLFLPLYSFIHLNGFHLTQDQWTELSVTIVVIVNVNLCHYTRYTPVVPYKRTFISISCPLAKEHKTNS